MASSVADRAIGAIIGAAVADAAGKLHTTYTDNTAQYIGMLLLKAQHISNRMLLLSSVSAQMLYPLETSGRAGRV